MNNLFARRTVRALVTVALTFATVGLWGVAAHAETNHKHSAPRMAESVTVCTQRDMVQGKVGEKVWTCETISYKHAGARTIAKR